MAPGLIFRGGVCVFPRASEICPLRASRRPGKDEVRPLSRVLGVALVS